MFALGSVTRASGTFEVNSPIKKTPGKIFEANINETVFDINKKNSKF